MTSGWRVVDVGRAVASTPGKLVGEADKRNSETDGIAAKHPGFKYFKLRKSSIRIVQYMAVIENQIRRVGGKLLMLIG
jgi:hypothetical protein